MSSSEVGPQRHFTRTLSGCGLPQTGAVDFSPKGALARLRQVRHGRHRPSHAPLCISVLLHTKPAGRAENHFAAHGCQTRLKDAMDDMKQPGEGLQLYAQV